MRYDSTRKYYETPKLNSRLVSAKGERAKGRKGEGRRAKSEEQRAKVGSNKSDRNRETVVSLRRHD